MTIFRHLLANLDPHSPFFSNTANQITKEFVNVNQHNSKFNSGVSFILKTLIFATFTKIMFFRKIIWRHTPFEKHKITEAKNFHNYYLLLPFVKIFVLFLTKWKCKWLWLLSNFHKNIS